MEHIIESSKRKIFDLKELWSYRELFYFFTWRDIKIKYKQTVLGFAWAVLQPLLLMIVFSFFFGRALNVPSQDLPYPVFVFSGLLLWNLFASGLTNSANSMVSNSQIIKKVYFPRLIVPASSVMVSFFDFLMALVVFGGILIFYRQPVNPIAIVLWPMAIFLSLVATLGPGCWLSALNVKYRDFRYVIPFIVQLMFFLTPIIYPISIMKYPGIEYLIALSPMYAAVELFRVPLHTINPNPQLILVSILSGLALFVWGLYYFRKTQDFFADFA